VLDLADSQVKERIPDMKSIGTQTDSEFLNSTLADSRPFPAISVLTATSTKYQCVNS